MFNSLAPFVRSVPGALCLKHALYHQGRHHSQRYDACVLGIYHLYICLIQSSRNISPQNQSHNDQGVQGPALLRNILNKDPELKGNHKCLYVVFIPCMWLWSKRVHNNLIARLVRTFCRQLCLPFSGGWRVSRNEVYSEIHPSSVLPGLPSGGRGQRHPSHP